MKRNKNKYVVLVFAMCLLIGGCKNGQSADGVNSADNSPVTVDDIAAERILNSDALYGVIAMRS